MGLLDRFGLQQNMNRVIKAEQINTRNDSVIFNVTIEFKRFESIKQKTTIAPIILGDHESK